MMNSIRIALPLVLILAICACSSTGGSTRISLEPGSADPPGMRAFLVRLIDALEAHDRVATLKLFDLSNLASQRGMLEMEDAQYIAEGIGLWTGIDTFEQALEAISSVVVTRIDADSHVEGLWQVSGRIELGNGRAHDLHLLVAASEDGTQWKVQPAVG